MRGTAGYISAALETTSKTAVRQPFSLARCGFAGEQAGLPVVAH